MEESKPGGENWVPSVAADHKSMAAFHKELEADYGIKLSRGKIQKKLISGGCWITERHREVQELFNRYVNLGMKPEDAIRRTADELEISTISVSINLPYGRVVYDLEDKSSNAKRIERLRAYSKRLI